MLRFFTVAFFGLLLTVPDPAVAKIDCYPYCDFTHYYGPLDFTYVKPGLFCYPRCGPRGDCSPYLACTYSRLPSGQVTVRTWSGTVTTTPSTASFTIKPPSRLRQPPR